MAFSPQYSAAVEAKQVAAQEAQRASFLVEKAIQQRQEKIVQAEGEAQSAKLVSYLSYLIIVVVFDTFLYFQEMCCKGRHRLYFECQTLLLLKTSAVLAIMNWLTIIC